MPDTAHSASSADSTGSADAARRRLLLQGAAAAAALVPWSASASGTGLQPWRPATAPVLDATDLATGQRRTLADFAGQPLLVNFWASWCGPCRVEMPGLGALARRLAPQGLRLVAVNHGEMPERVRLFLREVPLPATVLLDRSQRLLKAWGGSGALPATFVLDARGRPRAWAQGERDWDGPALAEQVRAAIEG